MADALGPETPATANGGNALLLVISWLWVGVPLAWGVLETVDNAMALFQ